MATSLGQVGVSLVVCLRINFIAAKTAAQHFRRSRVGPLRYETQVMSRSTDCDSSVRKALA
ncbi:hypothetical protein CFAM422_007345 [Trichoderma lentiforme]|uniref:Uncharacterized protein n=1 Tax=Trichoderma lentiforme TaxID=1567552 RepID=A0A9P4XDN5_9HYPO|nr:hypothetical protein CFAM422_007345 [Trichoderma lentiforme]